MKVTVFDRISYATPSQREYTRENFLRVPGYVAKVGIQEYFAKELQLDGDPFRVVRVMRPPESVFDPESLATFDTVDVTLEHPNSFVNSKNYKQLSKGHVIGAGRQDGEHVICDIIVKDQDTIDLINAGKTELSVGYTAEYVPVEHPDYEFIQKNITVNHVAVVDRARAGHSARFFDNKRGGNMKVVTIDGIDHEVPEAVAKSLAAAQGTIVQLTADKEKAEAERDNERDEVKRLKEERKEDDYDVEKLREENKALKDEKAENAKKEATKDALALTGQTFDGATPIEIKRQALDHMGVDTAGKGDAYIEVRYDMLREQKATVDTQHQNLANDHASGQKPTYDARSNYKNNLANAWKGGK